MSVSNNSPRLGVRRVAWISSYHASFVYHVLESAVLCMVSGQEEGRGGGSAEDEAYG